MECGGGDGWVCVSLTLSPSAGPSGTRPGGAAERSVSPSPPPQCRGPPTAVCCVPAGSERRMNGEWRSSQPPDSPSTPEGHRPGPGSAGRTPAPPGPDGDTEGGENEERYEENRADVYQSRQREKEGLQALN